MNRKEFMEQLENHLSRVTEQERTDALRFYEEYFDEAGPENEARVIEELGSPAKVAAQIKADAAMKNLNQEQAPPVKKGISAIWMVILGIFAAPIALPLAIAAVAVIFSLLVAGISVILSLFVAAIAVFGSGILCGIVGVGVLFTSVTTGFFYIGVGLVSVGMSLLLGILVFAVTRATFSGIAKLLNNARVRGQKRRAEKAAKGGAQSE